MVAGSVHSCLILHSWDAFTDWHSRNRTQEDTQAADCGVQEGCRRFTGRFSCHIYADLRKIGKINDQFEAGGCVSTRRGSIIMTLISQPSLSVDISKERSEGGFHFWTCFVGFTVISWSAVWLSTTRLTGKTQPAFKKPNLLSGLVHNTGFKLRVISGCSCLDLPVCRRGAGSSYHLFAELLIML